MGGAHALKALLIRCSDRFGHFFGICPLEREAKPLTIKGHKESGEIAETAYMACFHMFIDFYYDALHPI